MLGAMDHEPNETAACANLDLAARLGSDLVLAERHLQAAARELHRSTLANASVAPTALLAKHLECRREVAALRHLLDDMATCDGGRHAECA